MDGDKITKIQGIQVISRAADILRVLSEDTSGLSLGQIAKRVELPRSTVQRIVSALTLEGLVSTEKGIRLGPEIHSLAQASGFGMRDRLRPVMRSIAEETGETVDLAILEGGRMLFVDQIEGSHRLRTVSSIGERFPVTTTANGKAALACLDQAQAAKLIIREYEREGRAGAPLTGLLAEVDGVREGALAEDDNEHTQGICALGFAVRDPSGDVFALSVPVPASRYGEIKPTLEKVLRRWRAELSLS